MATSWSKVEDGVRYDYWIENGVVHRKLSSVNHKARLNRNAEVRKSGTRKMEWGKMVAEIPIPDLMMLRTFFGEALFNPQHDKISRRIARNKFLNSPASDPYRVEERKRKIK